MSVVSLYDAIYTYVSEDEYILNYLDIDCTCPEEEVLLEKAKHIQKRAKPQNLAENLPLISFYTPGGSRDDDNYLVYSAYFVFDIYTPDDVELAMRIAQRIADIFDGELPPFNNIVTFETYFESGHESSVDLENVYCFSVVLLFSYEILKDII